MKTLFTLAGVGILGYLAYKLWETNKVYADFLTEHASEDPQKDFQKTKWDVILGESGLQDYYDVSHDGFLGEFIIKNFYE
jgi:hypothetical protein